MPLVSQQPAVRDIALRPNTCPLGIKKKVWYEETLDQDKLFESTVIRFMTL